MSDKEQAEREVVIDGYEVVSRINSSGFGDLYLAKQSVLQGQVVIKIFPKSLSENEEWKKAFVHYISSYSRLSHSSLVKSSVCDIAADGRMYVVSDYIPSENLSSCLKRGLIDGSNILAVVIALSNVLDHSHEKSFYKHTIKPENVLIDSEGNVYLADVSAAGFLSVEDYVKSQGAKAHHYMAPEVEETGRRSPQSDIYSLAVILYEAFAGKVPRGVVKPLKHFAEVDDRLNDFVMKNLSAELGERTSTMEEFGDVLYAIENGKQLEEVSSDELVSSRSGAYSIEKLKQHEKLAQVEGLGFKLTHNSYSPQKKTVQKTATRSGGKRKKRRGAAGRKRSGVTNDKNLSSHRSYARSWPMIVTVCILTSLLIGGVYFSKENDWFSVQVKPDDTQANSAKKEKENTAEKAPIEKVELKKTVSLFKAPVIEVGDIELQGDGMLIPVLFSNVREFILAQEGVEAKPTKSQKDGGNKDGFLTVDFENSKGELLRSYRFQSAKDVKPSYDLVVEREKIQKLTSLNCIVVLSSGERLSSEQVEIGEIVARLQREEALAKASEPKKKPDSEKDGGRPKDYGAVVPIPSPEAWDLVIRKGWINCKDDRALLLLSFGSLEKKGKEDEEGDPQAARTPTQSTEDDLLDTDIDLFGSFSFQCAYSMDEVWDALQPLTKDGKPNSLHGNVDLAAGGFTTKWLGMRSMNGWTGVVPFKMRHVFQVDLSHPSIKGKAKYLLVKINSTYSSPESNYKNNVIALPLASIDHWTEVGFKEGEMRKEN